MRAQHNDRAAAEAALPFFASCSSVTMATELGGVPVKLKGFCCQALQLSPALWALLQLKVRSYPLLLAHHSPWQARWKSAYVS